MHSRTAAWINIHRNKLYPPPVMEFISVSRFTSHFVYKFVCCKMSNRGAELSSDQKELIVQLSEDGLSGSKVAELLKLNRFTVLKFLKRFKLCGSTENKHRSGRPRKEDARADRRLIRIVKINPRKTLQDLISVFNDQTSTKISRTTVKRRLILQGV